jgi:hypothetical protein
VLIKPIDIYNSLCNVVLQTIRATKEQENENLVVEENIFQPLIEILT